MVFITRDSQQSSILIIILFLMNFVEKLFIFYLSSIIYVRTEEVNIGDTRVILDD